MIGNLCFGAVFLESLIESSCNHRATIGHKYILTIRIKFFRLFQNFYCLICQIFVPISFKPFAKNPPISKIFREIGYADELGSGMRNSYKYTKLYSGSEPEFIEGDVFEIIIPLTTGAMTKVGPDTLTPTSDQAGTQGEHAGCTQAVTISLDAEKLNALLDYCTEPRTRAEMQEFCGIKTREYFRKKILVPMINSGKILQTIPDHPSSPNQKYMKA